MQLKDNEFDNDKEKNNKDSIFINENFISIFEDFLKRLNELNAVTTFGPFISMTNDPSINLNNLREYGNLLLNYQALSNKYLAQMINSYFVAINRVSKSIEEKKPEDIRKLIIQTFEDIFSSLFESPEYSINYNNLINVTIDMNKRYNKLFETSSNIIRQSLSNEEKESLFQNLYEIKKLSLEIKNKLNE